MNRFDARATTRKSIRMAVIVLAAVLSAHCQGRDRRPVVVPPPTPAVKPDPKPDGNQQIPGLDPGADDQDLGNKPPLSDNDPPLGGDTDPPDGEVTPPPTDDATLVITTTLDDGTTNTLEWDGRSFKGNDKFDVSGQ